MATRKHIHLECFDAAPEEVFALLTTPSAIRSWWGASRAIVLPELGGIWAATWGESEDQPDYITVAAIREFEPNRRLVLGDYRYRAKAGPLPFEADFVTEFEVAAHEAGATLKVTQDGFPIDPAADGYYDACATGWKETFAGIHRYLEEENA